MLRHIFDPEVWSRVPFHFWSAVAFIFGSMVGSFLNVCIHRMPLGLSIVRPPSHCPHCKYSIPFYLNIPLFTWLFLRAKCKNCGAQISARYFLVELLTELLFLACWLTFGHQSIALAFIYAGFLAALVVATFIDIEHMIIPDEITFGGMILGVLCSVLVPALHWTNSRSVAAVQSLLGMAAGAGIIYVVVRAGKLMFGRKRIALPTDTRITFTETSIHFEDKAIPFEELFYRQSDVITLRASTLELVDRCYRDVEVRLSPSRLQIGDEVFNPETVPHMEAVSTQITLPQEAMGLGDVKFMGAIGAFLGWKAVIFTLLGSSVIGTFGGLILLFLGRRGLVSMRMPYGPYLAIAAAIWVFWGHDLLTFWNWWLMRGSIGQY